MTSIPLDSGSLLPDIEHHFRVTAGPGAGKTYWLGNHIQHVARTSKRLTPCSRIGAISYTNVAVCQLLRRLGTAANVVDVSTIHSFLFRNLVRPYLHLLKSSDGGPLVAHHLVETHGEHYPRHDRLKAWLGARTRTQLLIKAQAKTKRALEKHLQSLTVRVDRRGAPFFASRDTKWTPRAILDLLQPASLLDYKQRYWKEGTIDHEDVLYFAHRLLREFPMLRGFFSARFPYLFIDEFQDTLPVQADLVKWLAGAGTVVGVIGDPEQAIFGFIDASPVHFQQFKLNNHESYEIRGNRRSSISIVSLLDHVRTDGLKQQPIRSEQGAAPVVYGGSLSAALAAARKDSATPSRMLVLARSHKGVVRARRADTVTRGDPWEAIQKADIKRSRFLNVLLTGLDFARRDLFDLAIQRYVQGLSSRRAFRKPLSYSGPVDIVVRRSVSLALLHELLRDHEEMLSKSVLDFYNQIHASVPQCLTNLKLQAVKTGEFRAAANEWSVRDLWQALQTAEETGPFRTIHQAKGAEAPAVFLALEDKAVDHILAPKPDDEEQRLTYVALSRARDELFIHCPDGEKLSEFGDIGCLVSVLEPSVEERAPKMRKASAGRVVR